MQKYQCISCGKTIASDGRSCCPVCGYTMYEQPYDRVQTLRSEIIRFLDCVIHAKYTANDLVFQEKEKDRMRFPDYHKIRGYIFSAKGTVQFHDRLAKTITEIKQHFSTSIHKTYRADASYLHLKADQHKALLQKALPKLDVSYEFEEIIFPAVSQEYQETPDPDLLIRMDSVLDLAEQLSNKIHQFIKLNNLFGFEFSNSAARDCALEQQDNWTEQFEQCCADLIGTLSKQFIIDILDDGKKELNEMLCVLLRALRLIMSAPILRSSAVFQLDMQHGLSEEDCLLKISSLAAERFSDLDALIHADGFLADQSEYRLFEIYDQMLELDQFGYLKAQKGTLLKTGRNEKNLEKLIGLREVKESIQKIKAFALANKNRTDLNLHMCFYGNPGTGKTEVARIIAGILHENGLLPADTVVETDRSGLVAGYVGQTAIKTRKRISEAMGGVLFIDEAYALVQGDSEHDFGNEAVAALIKEMEDHRGEFCVILAGYKNPMQEMLATNPGFQSRIQFHLDFPNYGREELRLIARSMLEKQMYTISDSAMGKLLDITDIKRKDPNFANAREVRNILDQVIMCQNLRCIGTQDRELALVDVNTYINDAKLHLPTSGDGFSKKILSADEELEQLIGLFAVKRMIKKIKAYAKRNRNDAQFNLHMCFNGNPGTGKTEVARILSRILYEADILPEAKLTETDAHGLIGKYVGETAPKTLARINDAMGGVLFIDEAYGLANDHNANGTGNGYGEEAIAVLLKEMEDKRGRFCVILAGYGEEMNSMISHNPGLASRIQFSLEFPDYTREELQKIALAFLKKKKYEMDDDAMMLVLDIAEYYRNRPNFANARTIRNILDQVIMNQNLRTEDSDEMDSHILRTDVEDYIADENICIADTPNNSGKIGF